jgi:hypothetical protein
LVQKNSLTDRVELSRTSLVSFPKHSTTKCSIDKGKQAMISWQDFFIDPVQVLNRFGIENSVTDPVELAGTFHVEMPNRQAMLSRQDRFTNPLHVNTALLQKVIIR